MKPKTAKAAREAIKTYRVKWEIDIEATSMIEAARAALRIQRDPDSIATVFFVKRHGFAQGYEVDLNLVDNIADPKHSVI